MATQAELNQVYNEVLGRNIDSSGAKSYKDMSIDEVRASLLDSQEYGFVQNRGKAYMSEEEYGKFGIGGYASDLGRSSKFLDINPYAGLSYADYKKKRREELETQYKSWWEEQTTGAAYGDMEKKAFSAFDAKGMSLEEMQFHTQDRAQFVRAFDRAKQRGEEFYASGKGLTDEFTETEGGQVVWLKEGQALDSDYYQDITDKLGEKYVTKGWRAYIDTGSKGGGGVVASVGSGWFGMHEFDSEDNWLGKAGRVVSAGIAGWVGGPVGSWGGAVGTFFGEFLGTNEGYAVADATSYNTNTRISGGQRSHEKSAKVYEENLGLNEGEWDRYADTAASVVVAAAATIAAPFTAGYSLAAIPAFTAWQGSSKRIGGTRAEQDANRWGDIAERTAWASAAAAAGVGYYSGYLSATQSVLASGAVGATQAKTRGGGTWEDAGWAAAGSVAGSRSAYAGAAVSAAREKTRGGGTWGGAAVVGGSAAAGAWAGGRASSPAEAAMMSMGINLGGDMLYDAVSNRRYVNSQHRNETMASRIAGSTAAATTAASKWTPRTSRQDTRSIGEKFSEGNARWWGGVTGKTGYRSKVGAKT